MAHPAPHITPPRAPFAPDNVRAISWLLLSIVASSAMTIAVRQSSLEIDSRMIVFLRFAVATALVTGFWFLPRRTSLKVQFSRPWLHLTRGLMLAVSTHLGFYAIAHLELVTATVLFFCAPIFATVFAGFLHGEVAGPRRLAAVGAGFLGVLIILRPGFGAFDPAMLTALASALLFGLALVLSRPVAEADGTFSTLLSTVWITTLMSIPLAIPVWQMPTLTATWIAVGALMVTGTVRTVADLQAYRFGEAASLAPIVYLRLVLIGGAGYLLYDEVPDATALTGAAVIVAAAIYIARREAAIKRRNSTAA